MSDLVGTALRRLLVGATIADTATVALTRAAGAVPDQGTPEFDNYLQALERNGFHLEPDTAWRLAHQTCEGGPPGFIGWELTAQGVVGPGAQMRARDVARTYVCPIQ